MKECSRCEALPQALPENGTLYIAPPLAHTQTTMRGFLKAANIPYEEPYPMMVSIPLQAGRLEQLDAGLGKVLSPSELRDCRSLILNEGVTPSIADLMGMQTLSTLLGRVQGDWLTTMLREGRFLSHFQPIVSAQQPDKVFAYEALFRGQEPDGTIIYPGRIFAAALSADMMFQLDRAARIAAVRQAAIFGIESNVFINFNPTSIYDPVYCLRTTLQAVREARMSPHQIIFEVVESAEIQDPDHLLKILQFYREQGFRVALDDLGAGYGSLNLLTRLKPDFVKLDIELIRNVDQDPYKAQVAGKILELARSINVGTIVEGVETIGEWEWARDHGADYAQGYLFARPGLPPPVPKVPTLAHAFA